MLAPELDERRLTAADCRGKSRDDIQLRRLRERRDNFIGEHFSKHLML